jgi:hypothetical protein
LDPESCEHPGLLRGSAVDLEHAIEISSDEDSTPHAFWRRRR